MGNKAGQGIHFCEKTRDRTESSVSEGGVTKLLYYLKSGWDGSN